MLRFPGGGRFFHGVDLRVRSKDRKVENIAVKTERRSILAGSGGKAGAKTVDGT